MTARQEGTADGECRGLSRDVLHHRSTRTPDSCSGALSYSLSSICSQPSNLMASTHVYRAMGLAPPFIPYIPKPFNRSVCKPPSKTLVRQPSSLNASQTADSSESSAETLLSGNNLLEKRAGICEAVARDAVGCGDDPDSARGMCSDPLSSNRLSLTISSRPDKKRKRVSSDK
jgi:hypothetical protein